MLDAADEVKEVAAFAAGEAVPAGTVFVYGESAVWISAAVGTAAAERAVIEAGAFADGDAGKVFRQHGFEDIILHMALLLSVSAGGVRDAFFAPKKLRIRRTSGASFFQGEKRVCICIRKDANAETPKILKY